MLDIQVAITGAAGQGIQTVGDIVSYTVLSAGYPVITSKEYESRIRGGKSSYRMRIKDKPPGALRERFDVLLALSEDAKTHYQSLLGSNGTLLNLPFSDIAKQTGGSVLYANSVAAGALVSTLGIEFPILAEVIRQMFAKKGREVAQANVTAVSYTHLTLPTN